MEEKQINFGEFLTGQNRIYEKFRQTKLHETGIVPRKDLYGKGSYLIVFRHSSEITESLAAFSNKLSKEISGITYNAANIHTTISDYDLRLGFEVDEKTLASLIESADITMGGSKSGRFAKIHYQEWLIGRDSIIVAGIPDELFFKNVKKIRERAKEEMGIDLRLPWGAHMTALRFNEEIDGKSDKIASLKKLVSNEAPFIGTSVVKDMEVCVQRIDENEHTLHPIARYSL